MSVELLMNITPTETRVALIEGGVLQELHIERQVSKGIAGNIYKGKVTRVLPGMQAAFIDIGLEKAAFLHASDIDLHAECFTGPDKDKFEVADISTLVRPGQNIMRVLKSASV